MLFTWINGVHNFVDATDRDRASAELAALDEVRDCLLKDFAAGQEAFLVWVKEDASPGDIGEMYLVSVHRSLEAPNDLRAVLIAQTRM